MKETLRTLIQSLPSGCVFDSHFVIDTLILRHSDAYLLHAADSLGNQNTAQFHGKIAQMVGQQTDLVQLQDATSYSYTIHGEPGPCALWRRV